ncbi:hypothetical protein N9B82_05425 [Saprospiraceae bacterium]|nr:hypothetical protein [Saprospiraceae bacterium]
MNKIKIVNQSYYFILLGLLTLLLIYNLYTFTIGQSLIGLVPIIFQAGLLYLLFTKNVYAQKIIKYWVGFICIVIQLVKLGSFAVESLIDSIQNEKNALDPLFTEQSLISLLLILFGIVILTLNSDFAIIEEKHT